ncbi:MAG: hypothetical protein E7021_02040 [Alphaproteobacteria bacterium]|nr:hypothetical protein [Alphaproteobacteria bacterium]
MPAPNLSIEIGKLMASVSLLQQQLGEIKQQVDTLYVNLKQEFVLKNEITPIKNLITIIVATTGTALIMALLNLVLK